MKIYEKPPLIILKNGEPDFNSKEELILNPHSTESGGESKITKRTDVTDDSICILNPNRKKRPFQQKAVQNVKKTETVLAENCVLCGNSNSHTVVKEYEDGTAVIANRFPLDTVSYVVYNQNYHNSLNRSVLLSFLTIFLEVLEQHITEHGLFLSLNMNYGCFVNGDYDRKAGISIVHPHGQITAIDFKNLSNLINIIQRHHKTYQRDYSQDYILALKRYNLVLNDQKSVLLAVAASPKVSYELQIIISHTSILNVSHTEKEHIAALMDDVFKIFERLGITAFNMVMHHTPPELLNGLVMFRFFPRSASTFAFSELAQKYIVDTDPQMATSHISTFYDSGKFV